MDKIKFPKEDFLKYTGFKKRTFDYQIKNHPKRSQTLRVGFLRENKLDNCETCIFKNRCKLQTVVEKFSTKDDFGCNEWESNYK